MTTHAQKLNLYWTHRRQLQDMHARRQGLFMASEAILDLREEIEQDIETLSKEVAKLEREVIPNE